MNDQELLDYWTARYTRAGWQVISRSSGTVILAPRFDTSLLAFGAALAPIGIGLFVIVIAAIDYVLQPNRYHLTTAAALAGTVPDPTRIRRHIELAVTLLLLGLIALALWIVQAR